MQNVTDLAHLCSAVSERDRPLVAKIIEGVIASVPTAQDRASTYYTPPAVIEALSRHVNDR